MANEAKAVVPLPWTYDPERGRIVNHNGYMLAKKSGWATDDEMRLMAAAKELVQAIRALDPYVRHSDECMRKSLVCGWQPDDPEPECVCGLAALADGIGALLTSLPSEEQG